MLSALKVWFVLKENLKKVKLYRQTESQGRCTRGCSNVATADEVKSSSVEP
jgi:hypothetical protein